MRDERKNGHHSNQLMNWREIGGGEWKRNNEGLESLAAIEIDDDDTDNVRKWNNIVGK